MKRFIGIILGFLISAVSACAQCAAELKPVDTVSFPRGEKYSVHYGPHEWNGTSVWLTTKLPSAQMTGSLYMGQRILVS